MKTKLHYATLRNAVQIETKPTKLESVMGWIGVAVFCGVFWYVVYKFLGGMLWG